MASFDLGYAAPTAMVGFNIAPLATRPGWPVADIARARALGATMPSLSITSSLTPSYSFPSSGGGGLDFTQLLLGAGQLGLNYALSKAQIKAQKRAMRAAAAAPYYSVPQTGGGYMYTQLTPGIGGSTMPVLYQTAPMDPGSVFGTTPPTPAPAATEASMLPALVGAARSVGTRLIPILAKYVAPAAAVELAARLISEGVTSGGPYRTEAANRAIAYRGDLAACKRLRAAGKAIGYARATGMRRSVRRGRRC